MFYQEKAFLELGKGIDIFFTEALKISLSPDEISYSYYILRNSCEYNEFTILELTTIAIHSTEEVSKNKVN